MYPDHGTYVPIGSNDRSEKQQNALDEEMKSYSWGGSREGAGRPHEHEDYVLVEVIDFHGDSETLIVGLFLKRDGTPNQATMRRAEDIAAHHVAEQARSVRILKKQCCSVGESVVLKDHEFLRFSETRPQNP